MSNDTPDQDYLIGFSISRVVRSHRISWCFIKPPGKDGASEFIKCQRLEYDPSKEHSDFLLKFSWGWKDITGKLHDNNAKMHFIKQRQKEEAYIKELNRRYKEDNNTWPIIDM